MALSSIGSGGSPGAAIAAGWSLQLEARRMQSALEFTGLLDPSLSKAFSAMEETGRSVVEGGVKLAGIQAVGSLIDALA